MQGFFTPLASRLARLRLAGILAITGKITGVERRGGLFAGRWRFAFHEGDPEKAKVEELYQAFASE